MKNAAPPNTDAHASSANFVQTNAAADPVFFNFEFLTFN
jgi:hypothetical protein